MWGSVDPDNRKPLWWKEYTFQPETRNNIQPGIKTYDSVGFNQECFDFYKKLVHIRSSNPVLSTGEMEFIITEGKMLMYKRYDKNDCIYVIFNLEPSGKDFTLPEKGTFINLLDNSKVKGNKMRLATLSGAILKKMK
jgi:Glycosidases